MKRRRRGRPSGLPYKPAPLRRPPPFQVDGRLKLLGAGLVIGEGSAGCHRREPEIHVGLCDRKAIEILSRSWGIKPTRGVPLECQPTPENPEGRSYRVRATGTRAIQIMHEYEPEITGTDIHRKWLKALENCPKRPTKPR